MVAIDLSYSMPDTGQLNLNSSLDPESELRERSLFVKQMMKHSWNSYVQYAWGLNELEPISKNGTSTDGYLLGTTIVDSLGTLYIMNMTDELKKARDWVENNLNFDTVDTELSVFYTNIKFVGGLLSAFALTKDKLYADKAKHIADKLLPAFNTLTGILINF
jgi:mannosyl-oligosaccharide alpha-1,2-mannosidase